MKADRRNEQEKSGKQRTKIIKFLKCGFVHRLKPKSVCMYVWSSHLAELMLLLFLTFSVLVANPKKLLYTVANPDRGLLKNREKKKKKKSGSITPPHTPHTARSEKQKNK